MIIIRAISDIGVDGFLGADIVAFLEWFASLLPFLLYVLHGVHALGKLWILALNFSFNKCSYPLEQRKFRFFHLRYLPCHLPLTLIHIFDHLLSSLN